MFAVLRCKRDASQENPEIHGTTRVCSGYPQAATARRNLRGSKRESQARFSRDRPWLGAPALKIRRASSLRRSRSASSIMSTYRILAMSRYSWLNIFRV
jgi:hypothetical protein